MKSNTDLIKEARAAVETIRGGYPSRHVAGFFLDLVPKLCDALEATKKKPKTVTGRWSSSSSNCSNTPKVSKK